MLHFFINTLCVLFSFASGYYRNMPLFALTAIAFWACCLWQGRARRTRSPYTPADTAGQGAGGTDGTDNTDDTTLFAAPCGRGRKG